MLLTFIYFLLHLITFYYVRSITILFLYFFFLFCIASLASHAFDLFHQYVLFGFIINTVPSYVCVSRLVYNNCIIILPTYATIRFLKIIFIRYSPYFDYSTILHALLLLLLLLLLLYFKIIIVIMFSSLLFLSLAVVIKSSVRIQQSSFPYASNF